MRPTPGDGVVAYGLSFPSQIRVRMKYQVTVRHGSAYQRYHTIVVEAADIRGALLAAADGLPDGVAADADLVEIRVAVDPDERTYVGEDGWSGPS